MSDTPDISRPVALGRGDIAPLFHGATLNGNSRFMFDTVAGTPIVLLFLGTGRWPQSADALALLHRQRPLFDDEHARFFGVTIDPDDAASGRIAKLIPGIRWFLDYDGAISRTYGVLADTAAGKTLTPCWFLLDPALRVLRRAEIHDGASIFAELEALIHQPEDTGAPVLIVPRLFEPDLCRTLIDRYETHGGRPSGFMREVDGMTVPKFDDTFKRRTDYHIEDELLQEALRARLIRRLVPQIRQAYQFEVTRIERWIVACYDAASGGFFRPHRDNTTAGTAHRRFACTINLNAEEFEGGELRFPEFGNRTYRAPTGGAVIFSCSLLHEATPVKRGRRYAFLPFFYDDDAARVREQNQGLLIPASAADTQDGRPQAMAAAG